MEGVEKATIEIDVWRFKIESLKSFNSDYSYRFEQNQSRVTINIVRRVISPKSENIKNQDTAVRKICLANKTYADETYTNMLKTF